uniref:(northern house mosquito) hypothetical protein n=1 Tax=Culex pipiens TaxID=7175 RepID=A0A8D8BKW0_CULPI
MSVFNNKFSPIHQGPQLRTNLQLQCPFLGNWNVRRANIAVLHQNTCPNLPTLQRATPHRNPHQVQRGRRVHSASVRRSPAELPELQRPILPQRQAVDHGRCNGHPPDELKPVQATSERRSRAHLRNLRNWHHQPDPVRSRFRRNLGPQHRGEDRRRRRATTRTQPKRRDLNEAQAPDARLPVQRGSNAGRVRRGRLFQIG